MILCNSLCIHTTIKVTKLQVQIFKKVQKSFKKITERHILGVVHKEILYLVMGTFPLIFCVFSILFPAFKMLKKYKGDTSIL